MKLGIHARLGAESPEPAEVASLAEELGFESLFLPEHTHIPACLLQGAGEDELDLLRSQAELFDPFVTLAAAELPGQIAGLDLPVTVFQPPAKRAWLERYREAGAERCVVQLRLADKRGARVVLEGAAAACL